MFTVVLISWAVCQRSPTFSGIFVGDLLDLGSCKSARGSPANSQENPQQMLRCRQGVRSLRHGWLEHAGNMPQDRNAS